MRELSKVAVGPAWWPPAGEDDRPRRRRERTNRDSTRRFLYVHPIGRHAATLISTRTNGPPLVRLLVATRSLERIRYPLGHRCERHSTTLVIVVGFPDLQRIVQSQQASSAWGNRVSGLVTAKWRSDIPLWNVDRRGCTALRRSSHSRNEVTRTWPHPSPNGICTRGEALPFSEAR